MLHRERDREEAVPGTGQTVHLTPAAADQRVITDETKHHGERTNRETQLILAVGHERESLHEMGQIKAGGENTRERDGQK